MSIYFLSFGGPSNEYHQAVNRICEQTKKTNKFNTILCYTETDLKNDIDFWPLHEQFIQNNKRGYGYWLWKSYLIKKTLNEMQENDILLYCDAGCEINHKYSNKINDLISITQQYKIIGCPVGSNDITYTKMDTIEYVQMTTDINLGNKHIQAGCLMMQKCEIVTNLISEWYNISSIYHLIDDSPSISPNNKAFIEHRHDQSIFNLLIKKYNLYNTALPNGDNDLIIYARNRSGKSNIGR